MSGTAPIHVLHVDDESGFADVASEFLERADDRFTVTTATSADEGLNRLADAAVDCVVSDYEMPGRNGIEFLEAVRDRHADLPFLLFTGKGSEEIAGEAISAGVTDYLQKGGGTDQYEILANRIANAVEARRSAARAQRRRDQLESILTTVPSCVVQLDTDGQFVYANDRANEVLGVAPDEVTDRRYDDSEWELRDPDGTPTASENTPFERVMRAGEPMYGFSHTIRWPDGTRKTLSMNGAPIYENGEVDSVVFSLADVTDERRRESALTAFHEVARELTACETREAVCERTVAASREILAFDVCVCSLHREGRLEAVASSDDREWGSARIDDSLAGAAFQSGESIRTDDADTDARAVEGVPYRSAITVPIGEFGVFQAVARPPDRFDDEEVALLESLLIHTENALRRLDSEERLRRQNERLEELTAVVGHDLRSPLTAARARLALAREERDGDHLADVEHALDRGEALIDELLMLAREGERTVEPESIVVADAVRDSWRGIESDGTTLAATPQATIRADPTALRRLLDNLLRNAVEHGGHEVRVCVTDDALVVADDGQGIDSDDPEQVFEPGYSTTPDGTGLGLAVVRRVAEAHDWVVAVGESADGGARVTVRGVTVE